MSSRPTPPSPRGGPLAVGLAAVLAAAAVSACAPFHPQAGTPPASLTSGNVTVDFSGVRAFTEGDVRDALGVPLDELKTQGVTAATADDAAFFLELFYRKNGYAQASANYVVEGPNRLRLQISEGPRTVLGAIRFVGNRHAPEANLRDFVVGPTRERLPSGTKEYPYVEADVLRGVDLIRRYYLAEGYLTAQVTPPRVDFVNGRTRADLTITVTEGTDYHFGVVTLAGPLVFPSAEVRSQIAAETTKAYTAPRVDSMARRLEEFYKRRGYYQAQVTARTNPAEAGTGGRVPVVFDVQPGPLFRFDGVTVRGTDRLKPQFLRNRFRKLSGHVYNPDELDALYQQMTRTGLFNLLRVTPVPQPDHTLRLELDATEAKAREFGLSFGYGTYEGPIIGFEVRDRDFRGTGRPVSLSVDYSSRSFVGQVLYQDPYLFETDNQFDLTLGAQTRDFDTYTRTEYSALAELARPLTKQLRVSTFVLAKNDRLSKLLVLPGNAGRTNYTVTSVGASATLDLRDNPVAPSRGLVASTSVDTGTRALGGDLEFVRSTIRVAYLYPVGQTKTTLALGFRAGAVQPFGHTVTAYADSRQYYLLKTDDPKATQTPPGVNIFPIDERFFNGGATSVRSFAERQLGPRDARTNQPIGGQAYTIFNVEYLFPLAPSVPDLRGAVFFDAGNLLRYAHQFGFNNERYAVGAGIRYNLPIGPLRLDYGINPDKRRNESGGAFHFAFGLAF